MPASGVEVGVDTLLSAGVSLAAVSTVSFVELLSSAAAKRMRASPNPSAKMTPSAAPMRRYFLGIIVFIGLDCSSLKWRICFPAVHFREETSEAAHLLSFHEEI